MYLLWISLTSATHLPCVLQSQDKVPGIRIFVSLLSEIAFQFVIGLTISE